MPSPPPRTRARSSHVYVALHVELPCGVVRINGNINLLHKLFDISPPIIVFVLFAFVLSCHARCFTCYMQTDMY